MDLLSNEYVVENFSSDIGLCGYQLYSFWSEEDVGGDFY